MGDAKQSLGDGVLSPAGAGAGAGAMSPLAATAAGDVKQKSVRAGAATLVAQVLKFALRTGSTMLLGRLVSPEDTGVQTMVIYVTGFLGLFRDAGLSMATVQREVITHEQTSTLFWINAAVGGLLAVMTAALA